jgi:hypothetical protein
MVLRTAQRAIVNHQGIDQPIQLSIAILNFKADVFFTSGLVGWINEAEGFQKGGQQN